MCCLGLSARIPISPVGSLGQIPKPMLAKEFPLGKLIYLHLSVVQQRYLIFKCAAVELMVWKRAGSESLYSPQRACFLSDVKRDLNTSEKGV